MPDCERPLFTKAYSLELRSDLWKTERFQLGADVKYLKSTRRLNTAFAFDAKADPKNIRHVNSLVLRAIENS